MNLGQVQFNLKSRKLIWSWKQDYQSLKTSYQNYSKMFHKFQNKAIFARVF